MNEEQYMTEMTMNNINSLERMLFEYEFQLPITQRERAALDEIMRLKSELKELKDNGKEKKVAKNRARSSGDS